MKLKNRIFTHFSPNLYFFNLIVNIIYQNALSFLSNLNISKYLYRNICAKWKSCFLCPRPIQNGGQLGSKGFIETVFAIFNNKNCKSYFLGALVI